MNKRCLFVFLAAFLPLGCGGDDENGGAAACVSVAEAFARAWERCQMMSYEDARALFIDSFACDENPGSSGGLDACVADIDALSCNAVNVNPSSCQLVLSE